MLEAGAYRVIGVEVDKIEVGDGDDDGDSSKAVNECLKEGQEKGLKANGATKEARTSVKEEGWVEERRDTKEGGRR